MLLENIGVEPCYTTEASQVQWFKIPDACELFIFVKSDLHAKQTKKILENHYGVVNELS